MKILVINAGSSSLKYQLMDPDTREVFAKGICERIGLSGRLTHKLPATDAKHAFDIDMPTHAEAIKAVIAALTPICVAQFKGQTPDIRTTQLAALKGESSWARGDFVEKQGWATMPGAKEPENEVADACAAELMKLASK